MKKKLITVTEEELENPVAVLLPPINIPADQINNLNQKEIALHDTGVTRRKYMTVIADALEAEKWDDVSDAQGNMKRALIPDMSRRQWAAEQAARLLGDYVEMKNVTVGHFTFMDLVKMTEAAKNRLPK